MGRAFDSFPLVEKNDFLNEIPGNSNFSSHHWAKPWTPHLFLCDTEDTSQPHLLATHRACTAAHLCCWFSSFTYNMVEFLWYCLPETARGFLRQRCPHQNWLPTLQGLGQAEKAGYFVQYNPAHNSRALNLVQGPKQVHRGIRALAPPHLSLHSAMRSQENWIQGPNTVLHDMGEARGSLGHIDSMQEGWEWSKGVDLCTPQLNQGKGTISPNNQSIRHFTPPQHNHYVGPQILESSITLLMH